MIIHKFKFATDAVEMILPMGLQWDLFYGQPIERDDLRIYAQCLDLQNQLAEQPDSYYIATDDGSLGMTIDDGRQIEWLARLVIPEPPQPKMPPVAETPMMVVKDEVKQSLDNVKRLFTFKGIAVRVLLTAITLLIVWIATIAWQRICVHNGTGVTWLTKTISYLTFASAGYTTNVAYILGGLIGKIFFMSTVIAYLFGGYKLVGKGFTALVDNVKALSFSRLKPMAMCAYGVGAACFLSNFFMGYASIYKTMICIVGAAAMIWALGGGISFIRRMTVALTADVQPHTRVRYVDMPNTMNVLTGMALGFVFSILPAWLLGPWTLYTIGTIFFVVGFSLASNDRLKGSARTAVLVALLLLPMGVSASDWCLKRVGVETLKDPTAKLDRKASVEMGDGAHIVFVLDETFRYTCSTPPNIIKRGDKVSLTIDNYEYSHVTLDYNSDLGGNNNPGVGETTTYREFVDGAGELWTENSIKDGGPDTRTVSLSLDDEYVGLTGEVPDGTKMAVVYHSPLGETRWIYEYHSDAKAAIAAADETDGESAADLGKIGGDTAMSGGYGKLD